jgi:hypothetical protein
MKRLWERHQTLVIIVATAIIAVIMVWANTWLRCREHFLMGEEYFQAKDWMKAIVAYETAIHAYTPWNSMIQRSSERLWEITDALEQAGDLEMALIALRSLRSSYYAVRSIYTPGKDWIERCDARISEILERQRAASKNQLVTEEEDGGKVIPPDELKRRRKERKQRKRAPASP